MTFRFNRATRYGALSLGTAMAGCASPADRVTRDSLPPSLVQRLTPNGVSPKDRLRTLPPDGIVPAAAVIPAAVSSADSATVPSAQTATIVPTAAACQTFTPDGAVRFALENNPGLQAFRQQRGFAQGGLVIAKTYPYNPVAQFQTFGAFGPPSAGITNSVVQNHKITMDVEIRGQRRYRQQAAYAALTRTEWDIATQELLVAVAANRAFNTVLYRQRKLDILNDSVKLNGQTVEQVKKLVDLGRLRTADLIIAQAEFDAADAQLGQGQTAIAFARADLRRQLGTLDDSFAVTGDLDLPLPATEFDVLAQAALEKRPDLQSRRFAANEAQARLKLQVADRYGNPTFGPIYELNETQAQYVGLQYGGPIPVFNRRTGEIIQAQATFAQAVASVKQFEIQSAQDVQAALARLDKAWKWADRYSAKVLPNLLKAVTDMNKLLEQNDPGVDALRVIGVQRNYLRAYDAYLDALFESSQGRADLAAAVADPALAIGLYACEPKPSVPLPILKPIEPASKPAEPALTIPKVQP